MKLPKNILIEKACSQNPSRHILGAVYLEKLEGKPHPARLLATNGRILAIVPVLADEKDATGYVTPEAFKQARQADKKSRDLSMTANGICKLSNGAEIARPEFGAFPNCDAVIPTEETKFSVSLDPELLMALAEAIGAERGVTLEISGEGKAIRVKPCGNPRAENPKGRVVGYQPACLDARGAIMPIQIVK